MTSARKILFIGLGFFEESFISTVKDTFDVILLDIDEENIRKFSEKYPDINTVAGDASSIITLKKIDFSEINNIICSIRDTDVVKEIFHILRDTLKVELPVLLISYNDTEWIGIEDKDITVINPIDIGSQVILNKLEKNLIRPINIGRGLGEIIEVTIKSASYLTGRRLKYLRPTNWHVSMIYRNNEPVIPTGEIKLKIGDRVIISGNPKVLENIANLLIKGTPQFPLQYGKDILYPLEDKNESCLLEAAFWLKNTNARKIKYIPYHEQLPDDVMAQLSKFSADFEIGTGVRLFRDIFEMNLDGGMIFLTLKRFFKLARIRHCFKHSRIPVLISKNPAAYTRILVSLNTTQPTNALETGIEISRLSGLPLELAIIQSPEELRSEEENHYLEELKTIIQDFQAIFNSTLTTHRSEGNPVRETLNLLEENPATLLIVVSEPGGSTGFFNTNIPFLLSRKSSSSVLMIPGDTTNG